jgi:DNA-binding transcriptional ArsR family regulator
MDEKERRSRNVAHMWQDKKVIRTFRKFPRKHYKYLKAVYIALTEIESDFTEHKEIKSFSKTLKTYCGLGKSTVAKYLRALEEGGLVKTDQDNSDGKFGHKKLILFEWKDEEKDDIVRKICMSLDIDPFEVLGDRGTKEATTVISDHGYTASIKNESKDSSYYKNSSIEESNNKKARETRLDLEKVLSFFPDDWQDNEEFVQSLSEFYTHRKELKKKLTKTAIHRLSIKLTKHDIATAIDALQESVANSWTGVFPRPAKGGGSNKKKIVGRDVDIDPEATTIDVRDI